MVNKRTALVTGANKGIGFAIARQLGDRDHAVWLGCRDQGRGAAAADKLRAAGIDARVVLLDVTDDQSVAAAATTVGGDGAPLDVLVNNAGMNFGLPPEASGEKLDEMRAMFETNALGPVRVTQAFLPLLRRSGSARIVMISSGLGSHALTTDMTSENWSVGMAGYCASKSALNMFGLKLARELLAEGVKVNMADPGLTDTDLGGGSPMATRTPEEAAAIAVHLATLNDFGPTGGFFHYGYAGDPRRHPW